MKKLTVLFSLYLLTLSTVNAQVLHNVYKDAIALSTMIADNSAILEPNSFKASDKTWPAILKSYIADTVAQDSINSTDKLAKYYSTNPFLSKYISVTIQASALTSLPTATSSELANNFSASSLSSAIVNVIIERAKQELTVAFFDHFKSTLQNNPSLDTLFPKTSAFIVNIESYLYAGALNTLRQAFATDLANLPIQIPAAMKTDQIKNILIKDNLTKAYLALPGFSLVDSILKGKSAGNSVKGLYPDPLVKNASVNVYAILQTIATLSESIRDSTGKSNWIKIADFNANIASKPTSVDLFLGLLYEETKTISFQTSNNGASATLASLLTKQNFIQNLATALNAISTAYTDLDTDIQALAKTTVKSNPSRFDQIITTINDIAPECQTAVSSVATLVGASTTFQNDINKVFQFIPQMAIIVQNVRDTQYSTAVFNSVILIGNFMQNSQNTTVQTFLKYASFMASIAEAKTSSDISTAIDAAILPVGSSSIKANTAFSISINSYIGAGLYWEKYKSKSLPNKNISLPTFGVSLPIGVAFNWGLRSKAIGSFSLFASVIDLGAVATFKLSTPDSVSSQSLPNFTWQNLLAPGIYCVFGRLGNSPVALGFGIQKGPQLRSINYTSNGTTVDLSQNEQFRYGLFLNVDIPFFNLFSVPYEKPYTQ